MRERWANDRSTHIRKTKLLKAAKLVSSSDLDPLEEPGGAASWGSWRTAVPDVAAVVTSVMKEVSLGAEAPQKRAPISLRYHQLSEQKDCDNAQALHQARGEGWKVLAEGLGVSVESLVAHPQMRRAIELAAASNNQPKIFSRVEAEMLLEQLEKSEVPKLTPITQTAIPQSLKGVKLGPGGRQMIAGDFEGTVKAQWFQGGKAAGEASDTPIDTPIERRRLTNVVPLNPPKGHGDTLELIFEPQQGPGFVLRVPRRTLSTGAGSAGYRSLNALPNAVGGPN